MCNIWINPSIFKYGHYIILAHYQAALLHPDLGLRSVLWNIFHLLFLVKFFLPSIFGWLPLYKLVPCISLHYHVPLLFHDSVDILFDFVTCL